MNDIPLPVRHHADLIESLDKVHLSEADTRVRLVDPLLHLIGYNSIDEIRREVPVAATKEFLDYELRVDGIPTVIVEAKALRQEITEKHAGQCVAYAAVLGVPWCIITNGETWAIYYAYSTRPLPDKLVTSVRISGDDRGLGRAWSILAMFGRESLRRANPMNSLLMDTTLEAELSAPDSVTVEALRKAAKARFGITVSGQFVADRLKVLRSRSDSQDTTLALPAEAGAAPSAPRLRGETKGVSQLQALIDAKLLPFDAAIECTVYGKKHSARLRSGQIELQDRLFGTPSAAAASLRNGKASNGWVLWKHKGRLLADIRKDLEEVGSANAPDQGPPVSA